VVRDSNNGTTRIMNSIVAEMNEVEPIDGSRTVNNA
jgi:hypothetical protein